MYHLQNQLVESQIENLDSECVIQVKGIVQARPEGQENKVLVTENAIDIQQLSN